MTPAWRDGRWPFSAVDHPRAGPSCNTDIIILKLKSGEFGNIEFLRRVNAIAPLAEAGGAAQQDAWGNMLAVLSGAGTRAAVTATAMIKTAENLDRPMDRFIASRPRRLSSVSIDDFNMAMSWREAAWFVIDWSGWDRELEKLLHLLARACTGYAVLTWYSCGRGDANRLVFMEVKSEDTAAMLQASAEVMGQLAVSRLKALSPFFGEVGPAQPVVRSIDVDPLTPEVEKVRVWASPRGKRSLILGMMHTLQKHKHHPTAKLIVQRSRLKSSTVKYHLRMMVAQKLVERDPSVKIRVHWGGQDSAAYRLTDAGRQTLADEGCPTA